MAVLPDGTIFLALGLFVLTIHASDVKEKNRRFLSAGVATSTASGIEANDKRLLLAATTAEPAPTYRWASWSSWSNCNTTCGVVGVKTRRRSCTRVWSGHATAYATSSHCRGDSSAVTPCYTACPDAIWSNWSAWSKCSATCADGIRYRARHCTTGNNCVGDVLEQEKCTMPRCLVVVDGLWGSWASWGQCSKTCGNGVQYRFRNCDNPAPQDGGKNCSGINNDYQLCTERPCPIDGGWSNYTERPCSVSCGIGVSVTVRFCTNPAPQHGGKSCEGSATKFATCTQAECVIDGGWSAWSNASDCAVICGDGYRRQSRTCTNPTPKHGGKDCLGTALNLTECYNGDCPDDIKVCNKTAVLKSIVISHENVKVPGGYICPTNQSMGTSRSLMEAMCDAPIDESQWKLGIRIQDNCLRIPLYVPVGVIDRKTKVKQYGIMMECEKNVLTIASQNCTSGIHLVNIVLDHNTSDYHLLLW